MSVIVPFVADDVSFGSKVRVPINDGDAISLLTHDIGNTLMVIQSRLDSLRSKVGSDQAFLDIQEACHQSATVLRGALTLIDKNENPKKLISMGEYIESQLTILLENTHYSLSLRTHQECQIFTCPETLNMVLRQVLNHFRPPSGEEGAYLSLEIYQGDYEKSTFGVINLSGPGTLSSNQGTWKMLESLMHLQGGELVLNTAQEKPEVCLMFPIFTKRHSLYAIRSQSEDSSALIIEDNVDVADTVSMTLHALGITQVEIFHNASDALSWLEVHTPSLVVTDYSMLGMNGIELLKQAEAALASSTVVLMSGMPPEEFEQELQGISIPVQILMKPLKGDDMLQVVMQSLMGAAVQTGDVRSLKELVHAPQRPDIPYTPEQ